MSSLVQSDSSGIFHRGSQRVQRYSLGAAVSSTSALGTKVWFTNLVLSQPSQIRVSGQMSLRCTAVSRPFCFVTIGGGAFGINGGSPDGTFSATIPCEALSIVLGPATVEIAWWMGRSGSGTVTCDPIGAPASDNFALISEIIRT